MNLADTIFSTLDGAVAEFGLLVELVISHSISQPVSLFVMSLGSALRTGNPCLTTLLVSESGRPAGSPPPGGGPSSARRSWGGPTAWSPPGLWLSSPRLAA